MRWTGELRLTCAAQTYGEVVWFGRRGAGVKLAIRSAGDGGKRAVLREEHEVSRKTIAQGRPECSRCPVCSCAVFVCANRTRDRGCSKHPVFPAPSEKEGERRCKPRAVHVARSQTHTRLSSPGLTGRPSIPETPMIEPISRSVLDPRMRGDDGCGPNPAR
jgi:hypothetical protein